MLCIYPGCFVPAEPGPVVPDHGFGSRRALEAKQLSAHSQLSGRWQQWAEK